MRGRYGATRRAVMCRRHERGSTLEKTDQPRTRRQLVFGAFAAAAAAAVGRAVGPERAAAASSPMQTEIINGAEGTTSLYTTAGVGFGAKTAQSTAAGVVGVVGPSTVGIGVIGQDAGVYGLGASGSGNSVGVWGNSDESTGVVGSGPWGVYGTGGVGVAGDVAPGATGVYGFVGTNAAPVPTANVAVEARAETSSLMALNVVGRASFSRSGRLTFRAGQSALTINMSRISSTSLIIAVPQTYQAGVWVMAA